MTTAADVSVRIRPDTELESARTDAKKAFSGITDDAKTEAELTERAFDGAGKGIAGKFEEARVEAAKAFDRITGDARDAADGIERPFAQAADGVEQEATGLRAKLSRTFDRIRGDARDGADGIERPFSRGFARIEDEADSASERIGQKLSGIGDAVDPGDLAGSLSSSITGALSATTGAVAGAGLLVGGLVGEELARGLGSGFRSRSSTVENEVRTGLSGLQLRGTGQAAGEAFSRGFGEGLGDLRFEVAAVQKELAGLDFGGSTADVAISTQILSDQFGVELPKSIDVTRRAIANGLADDAQGALGLVIELFQRLPLTAEEGLDVLDEYASTFGALNIGGAGFVDWIEQVERSGAFENVDKGADSIRELVVRLRETERVQGPLAELGLDVEKLQQALADGRGVEGINAIIDALLRIEDPVRQTQLANELLGTAFEDVTDTARALEAIKLGQNFEDLGNKAEEAARKLENSRTAWDDFSRGAESAADQAGSLAGSVFDLGTVLGVLPGDTDAQARANRRLAETFGLVNLEATEGARVLAGEVRESFGRAADFIDDAVDSQREFAFATDETVGSLDELASTLAGFFDFSYDQIIRDLEASIDDMTEAVTEADSELVGLNGEIDVGEERGRELQASLEDVTGSLLESAEAYREGRIDADEFNRVQALTEQVVRDVAGAMGLTEAQTQGLIDKYASVPAIVETDVKANDRGASNVVDGFLKKLGRIPKSINVPIRASGGGGVGGNFRAAGGPTVGVTTVGEHGPELGYSSDGDVRLYGVRGPETIDFRRQTTIIHADETARRLGLPRLASGGTAFDETLALIGDNPNSFRDPEIVSPESRIEAAVGRALEAMADRRDGPALVVENMTVEAGRSAGQELAGLQAIARMVGVG